MAKNRTVQFRLTDEESEWLDNLAGDYGVNRTELILHSLEYVKKNRPKFVIQPREIEIQKVPA